MLIFAKQPIYYLIEQYPDKIKKLYIAKELDKKEFARLNRFGFELKRIPNEVAVKMAKGGSHQGFLAEVDEVELTSYKKLLKGDFVVVLSGVTDVGNIGSLVRSCYALGVDGVIATGVKKLPLEALVRVSTGALYDLPFAIEHNIYDVLNDLKTSGFSVYGADMNGVSHKKLHPKGKKALVLGSEGEGLPKRVVSKLHEVVSIEMQHQFDSLNVAVAGAILIDRMRDE